MLCSSFPVPPNLAAVTLWDGCCALLYLENITDGNYEVMITWAQLGLLVVTLVWLILHFTGGWEKWNKGNVVLVSLKKKSSQCLVNQTIADSFLSHHKNYYIYFFKLVQLKKSTLPHDFKRQHQFKQKWKHLVFKNMKQNNWYLCLLFTSSCITKTIWQSLYPVVSCLGTPQTVWFLSEKIVLGRDKCSVEQKSEGFFPKSLIDDEQYNS